MGPILLGFTASNCYLAGGGGLATMVKVLRAIARVQ